MEMVKHATDRCRASAPVAPNRLRSHRWSRCADPSGSVWLCSVCSAASRCGCGHRSHRSSPSGSGYPPSSKSLSRPNHKRVGRGERERDRRVGESEESRLRADSGKRLTSDRRSRGAGAEETGAGERLQRGGLGPSATPTRRWPPARGTATATRWLSGRPRARAGNHGDHHGERGGQTRLGVR